MPWHRNNNMFSGQILTNCRALSFCSCLVRKFLRLTKQLPITLNLWSKRSISCSATWSNKNLNKRFQVTMKMTKSNKIWMKFCEFTQSILISCVKMTKTICRLGLIQCANTFGKLNGRQLHQKNTRMMKSIRKPISFWDGICASSKTFKSGKRWHSSSKLFLTQNI